MLKGYYVRVNVSELPRHCIINQGLCNIFVPVILHYFSSCAAVFIFESLPVVGFSPHVDTTGVFGIAHNHT